MVASVTSVTTMPMKEVHQRAGEQEQIGPLTGQVCPVFTNQVEGGDGAHHRECRGAWRPSTFAALISVLSVLVFGAHGSLLKSRMLSNLE